MNTNSANGRYLVTLVYRVESAENITYVSPPELRFENDLGRFGRSKAGVMSDALRPICTTSSSIFSTRSPVSGQILEVLLPLARQARNAISQAASGSG